MEKEKTISLKKVLNSINKQKKYSKICYYDHFTTVVNDVLDRLKDDIKNKAN